MTKKSTTKTGRHGLNQNHNETLVRDGRPANLKTKTDLRAGTYKIIVTLSRRVPE
jgi:hypothetical protein